MTEERRHQMEELATEVAEIRATLDAHVKQEDRDRAEQVDTLKCIKKQITDIRLELAEYRGKVGLAAAVLGLVVAAASTAAGWLRA